MQKDQLTTRSFWMAATMRAVRSAAQAILVLAGANAADLFSTGWLDILLAALGMAVVSILTSVTVGIPEVPNTPVSPPEEPQIPPADYIA